VRTCSTCGRENPDDAGFCSSCGSALGDAGSAREERKVVTVIFADLVGFTSRSERLDPEDVRATLTPYFARLREELERHGGTVEKFIGDAVMAVFGAPTAHEDDPERAVRAGLAIRDALTELNDQDPDLDLHVRVGVNTGEALVSLGANAGRGEGMAAGDVVNTAARLQAAAPVDGIYVGESTFRATERAIGYRAVDAVLAKGKSDPVTAWEAIEARARFGVDVIRRTDTALVGREQELTLLRDTLDRVRHRKEPQLVTLVGEPGIGKTRLVYELSAHVEDLPDLITWRQGRCLPYGDGVSFWALGEIVKAEAGILETDPDVETAAKIDEMIRELIPDPDEGGWVARHLRPLIGLARDPGAGNEVSEETQGAWRRFLESLAERRAAVLIFEDLHWADDGLLDFLDQLIEWAREVPLLVLGTARPELLARRPGWGGGKLNAATVSLAPLSDEETARLLAGLLDRALLPADLQAALLSRAGGNPLYAEEFARMAADRSASDLAELELPDSVQGIIAARLDGLDSENKALLQDAAVVGKAFWLGAVTTIGGRDPSVVEGRLHELERGRFVRRARRSSVGGETEFAFLHLLVRDVAYGQIPRAARADKHRAAAAWIESLGGERLEDRAELLAHHYRSALELARAAGRDTADLEGPARLALRAAGDRAMGLGAYAAAARAYAAAVELWPAGDPERPRLLLEYGRALTLDRDAGREVLAEARDALLAVDDVEAAAVAEFLIANSTWRLGRGEEAREHFDRGAAMIEDRPPSVEVAQGKGFLATYLMVTSQSREAIRVGREALAIVEQVGAEDIRAQTLNSVGTARVDLGDLGGLEDIRKSIEVGEASNLPFHVSRGYVNLGVSYFFVGDVRRALEAHRRGFEMVTRYGIESGIIWTKAEVAFDLFLLGRWDEALEIVDEEIARMEAGAPHYIEVQHRQSRARIRLGRGDPHGALADADRGVEVGRSAQDLQALMPTLAERGRILFQLGREEEAVAAIDEVLGSIDPEPAMGWAWWIVPAAVVLSGTGRADEILALGGEELPCRWIQAARRWAMGDLPGAADLFDEIGSASDEAAARTNEAEHLIAEGRRAEAEPFLSRALELYRTMGATAFIQEAERLLAPPA
jgi:class 3 adenylate cyclase/tetratricopeptide (TPR) repeat protein